MRGQQSLDQPLRLGAELTSRLRNIPLPPDHAVTDTPTTDATQSTPSRTADTLAVHSAHALPQATVALPDSARSEDAQPDWYWTWKVMAAGCSLSECQHIRQLNSATIGRQLLAAARNGHRVPASWLLSPEQLTQLEDLRGAEATPATQVPDQLPAWADESFWHLFLLDRQACEERS